MQRQVERPFDFLESLRGKYVSVTMKAYKEFSIEGILLCWDPHLNIVLEVVDGLTKKKNCKFLKGDGVVLVEENA